MNWEQAAFLKNIEAGVTPQLDVKGLVSGSIHVSGFLAL